MRFLPVVAAAAVAFFGFASDAAAQCMRANQAGEIAEGRLSQRSFKDAAGRASPAFILTVPVATCVTGAAAKRTRSIQVYSSNSRIQGSIRRFVGKTVMVRGRAFPAQTAHHHAPIVMDISEIDSH